MSYSDFTLQDLRQKLGIQLVEDRPLFPKIPHSPVPEALIQYLQRYKPLALSIDTEKARSEYIIAPILGELKVSYPQQLSLFSGLEFNLDLSLGLSGRCDFVIARSKDQYIFTAPAVVMVEAKNDNIKGGIAQCGAEMVAAQRFNLQNETPIDPVYGCISTGTIWKFLALSGNSLTIDSEEYYIDNLTAIFGILTQISLGQVP